MTCISLTMSLSDSIISYVRGSPLPEGAQPEHSDTVLTGTILLRPLVTIEYPEMPLAGIAHTESVRVAMVVPQ